MSTLRNNDQMNISADNLANFIECPRYSKFEHNKIPLNENSQKIELIETFSRKIFCIFHEIWTDYCLSKPQLNNQRLDTILSNIAENKIKSKLFSIPNYKYVSAEMEQILKRYFSGSNNIINQIKSVARNLNNVFAGSELVRGFFSGEHNIQLPLQYKNITATSDCIITDKDDFYIWNVETSNPIPSSPPLHHIFRAALYAYMFEKSQGLKCIGLRISYLGQKSFDIPYDSNKTERQLQEILKDYLELMKSKDEPPVKNIEKCNFCKYANKCKESSDIGINLTESEDKDDEIVHILNESGSNDANQVKDEPTDFAEDDTERVIGKLMDFPEDDTTPVDEDTDIKTDFPEDDTTSVDEDTDIKTDILEEPKVQKESKEETISSAIDYKYIGKVIHNENKPLRLSLVKDNQLNGAIKNDFNKIVYPGQILIAEDIKDPKNVAAITELIEIDAYPKTIASIFHKIDSFNIEIITRPFMYYEKERYSKVLYPANFENHMFRKPDSEELIKILHLHDNGIPLGIVTYENCEYEIPPDIINYYFPFDTREIGYKGIFIVGSPGKGKTNLLKLMVDGIANYICPADHAIPTLIILDLEGQFKDLNTPTKVFSAKDQELWNRLGIKLCKNVETIKIKYKNGDGTHTLALNNLDPELISLLFPELPPKSAQNFNRIVQNLLAKYPSPTYIQFIELVKKQIENQDEFNPQIRKAIINALENGPIDYFDQGGEILTIDKLMQPGKIISIQVNHIYNPLPILLYILILLNKRKIFENDLNPVLIMIDEIHQLFPKGGGENYDQDYLNRITTNLIQFARRGRKKRLGLIFASQQPHDVIPEIIGVFQTKFILGLEPTSANWIKEEIGREYVEMIMRLPIGVARIKCAEIHGDTLVPIIIPKAPNKHEQDNIFKSK